MTRFRIINWWIARKLEGFHILLAAGGILVCLGGIFAEQPAVSRGGGIFLLCLAVVVLIHENLHRFWDYLENHQDLDRLPAGQMKQVNLFLLLCFLTVFLGFVFLAGFFPWKETGELLYAGIRTFFRFLASLFPKGEEEYEMGEGEAGQLLSGMEFLEGGGENDPFWEMVSYVFAAVTAVGFGLFLLYLLVRKIAEYLGSLTFDGDEKVFLKPEEIVKKGIPQQETESFLFPVSISFRQPFGAGAAAVSKKRAGSAWDRTASEGEGICLYDAGAD